MAYTAQGASTIAPNSPVLSVSPLQTRPVRGQPHVYLLATKDRTRLKIGRSIDPLERIAELCRVYPEVDLSRSVILAVDAKIVEKILHDVFQPYRLALSPRRDGSTEWFVGDFADEVVDFCQRIARHREANYSVIRNLPILLQEHFSQRQTTEITKPAPAKRDSRLSAQPVCLTELATYQARQFVKTLQERQFDEIVVQNKGYFLVRTVRRNDEPECWKPAPWLRASDWGLKLLGAGMINGRSDGASFFAQLIQIPNFQRHNSEWGQEYYRLERGPEPILHPAVGAPPAALDLAFAILWEALAHLPQRTLPLPPSAPARNGFQRRYKHREAKPAPLVTTDGLEMGRA